MKTVYFIRHGESEANARGITAGSGLDVGLTEHGKYQAQKVGEELKDKKIGLIVSSPLKRAADTAKIIAETIGYSPDEIAMNELFAERYLGELTGADKQLVKTHFDMGGLPASAETTGTMQERIIKGLEWLKTQDANNIILVSHGGPGRMIRTIYRQEHHSRINSLSKVGNAEILQLSL
jgi:broad specificity phosphatase PhoE